MPLLEKLNGAVAKAGALSVSWHRRTTDSWLDALLGTHVVVPGPTPREALIDERASITAAHGSLPLWDGYGSPQQRTSDEVRTDRQLGRLYSRIVRLRRPEIVVEFGTAFGVSGMYWLDGICASGRGQLLTFEPNAAWRELAVKNLEAIGPHFVSTLGTFEDHIDDVLGGNRIDVAFIDAIHTSAFVEPQFEKVAARLSSNGIIVLDDINFSDDMRQCWTRLAVDDRVRASAAVSARMGIIELA